MRIPHINRYAVAKAAVLTKKTGKNIVKYANNCAIAHDINSDKLVSTIMIATTFVPKFDAKVAKMVQPKEVVPVVTNVVKKSRVVKNVKIVPTPKTPEKIQLIAKGVVENPSQLNKNFNDLLLENENRKNPLNNKGYVFLREAKKHGVNPTLLMAIAMHESARGTSNAVKVQRNIGGIMSSKGNLKHYSTIDLCIDQMAETLAYHHRENKINNMKELASAGKYCSKDEAKEWIKGVMYYINELQSR